MHCTFLQAVDSTAELLEHDRYAYQYLYENCSYPATPVIALWSQLCKSVCQAVDCMFFIGLGVPSPFHLSRTPPTKYGLVDEWHARYSPLCPAVCALYPGIFSMQTWRNWTWGFDIGKSSLCRQWRRQAANTILPSSIHHLQPPIRTPISLGIEQLMLFHSHSYRQLLQPCSDSQSIIPDRTGRVEPSTLRNACGTWSGVRNMLHNWASDAVGKNS